MGMEVVCKNCGQKLEFELTERPWNGYNTVSVAPCKVCTEEAEQAAVDEWIIANPEDE